IAEETGYTDLRLVRVSDVPGFGYFYSNTKHHNVFVETTGLLFDLVSDKQDKESLDEGEVGKFTVEWQPVERIAGLLDDGIHEYYFRTLVLDECFGGVGRMINSGEFDGMDSEEAKWAITEKIDAKRMTNYRLRDWLVSRQRYWGAPIPMIWCDSCAKWMPERGENLPILLPDVKDFRPTGTDKSPLANFPEFYETTCPECGKAARRETDVCDTFLDSSWYYLRYLDPKNDKELCSPERARRWLPVASYIGGAEHSVLHLLYVRFVSMALHDLKLVDFAKDLGGEPMPRFRAHGLITKDGAKMSKSRGNVVNPDEYFSVYGADALRMYLAFMSPLEEGGDFRDTGIKGMMRFLIRTWDYYLSRQSSTAADVNQKRDPNASNKTTNRLAHKTVKKVTEDMERLQNNTAISALMVLLTQMEEAPDAFADSAFLLMLAPLAPFITEEIFSLRGSKETIHKGPWPQFDTGRIADDTFELVIQINGKVRDTVAVASDISEADVKALALSRERIKEILGDKALKKVIFVPRRLINLVQ
ncbi:MAG: class I tRNA ligase family protein, partial [Patescibacteria group bacterium]